MLREGPLPAAVHGSIEYAVGVFFIAAPFLFGYLDGWAIGISIAVGVVVLVLASATALPTGLVRQIPVSVHLVLDFILALFLIAAPFLFGFREENAPLAVFIVLGVAHLLITIATRFRPPKRAEQAAGGATANRPRAGRGASGA